MVPAWARARATRETAGKTERKTYSMRDRVLHETYEKLMLCETESHIKSGKQSESVRSGEFRYEVIHLLENSLRVTRVSLHL